MEKPNFHKLFPTISLLKITCFFLLISSSQSYTPPDKYFISCGSKTNFTFSGRSFVGDDGSGGSYTFSSGKGSTATGTGNSSLYDTARVFTNSSSSYQFDIFENGTYFLRLHFYPVDDPVRNLSSAVFDVSASGSLLLSNFGVGNGPNSVQIKEFLLFVGVGKFEIGFSPSGGSVLAFVNAIELFLAPKQAVPDSDSTPLVSVIGNGKKSDNDLHSSTVLHPVHRINVGGSELNDLLWRNWVPDDGYLFIKDSAKNSSRMKRPQYQNGGADEYSAPDLVYQTAKEMNIIGESNFFNITWSFPVRKGTKHFVRVHFCDIVSPAIGTIKFYFYIYRNFSVEIYPYDRTGQLAAPFYNDYVVDSNDFGFINISVGPQRGSTKETAFLNGLEIMEMIQETGAFHKTNKSNKNSLFIIVGAAVGGVVVICILVILVLLWLKYCRKSKPIENSEWRYQDPSSYSRVTEGTTAINSSPVPNLNLGLIISFAEILFATNGFDPKLVIGEGGFGKVYKGTRWNGEKVAIKRSQPGQGQGFPEFQTEIMILSKIRHHHLVSLIGYCEERSEMILVYEFMEKGTLRDHLYGHSENSRTELTWKQRLEICIGSARGLHYLHTGSAGGIIHRDVKSTNILLDENFVAKVADFGLSKDGPLDQNETHVSTAVKGSFGYLDPEYFRCMQLTDKSDVYSFGVVLLEVLCARAAINGSLPREQVNLAEWGMFWQTKGQLEKIIDPLLVGNINVNSLRKFGETAEKCLKEYGAERPAMGDVLWDLEYALQLQKTAVLREPHEDSTVVDTSMPMLSHAVKRLPSCSLTDFDDDQSMVQDDFRSLTTASDIFSQLKIDGAR